MVSIGERKKKNKNMISPLRSIIYSLHCKNEKTEEKLDNLSGYFENSIYTIFILQALREVSTLLSRIFK
jgi:hypothetical protein